MPFDIDLSKFSELELIQLNSRIVERLRIMQRNKTFKVMMKFNVGDQVCFKANDGRTISGIITKFNQKTVSLLTADKIQWNVSPGLLQSVIEASDADDNNLKIIQMKKV